MCLLFFSVCNQVFFHHYYTKGTKNPKCQVSKRAIPVRSMCHPGCLNFFLLHSSQECLPDCELTTYSARVSSAPIRRCDGLNLGSSFLCLLSAAGEFRPQLWADLGRSFTLKKASLLEIYLFYFILNFLCLYNKERFARFAITKFFVYTL